ncbi:MAG TPA: DEAD/DEAH box helicase, partial [Steroidobacteraceae bacterium]|nr:DEAD/DEAH box helicase [Steroidobacteraceae bacterium]
MHAAVREYRSAREKIEQWFAVRGWSFAPFQAQALEAYLRGESGLIHSPTGTGKTLAAWLGPLAEALQTSSSWNGLRVLWITPLRALANDIQRNLTAAASALEIRWDIGLRTGDTSSTLRKKQRTSPPHCLVTTPESLSIMMSFSDSHDALRSVQAVIVDEWHELLGTKRGVQLELCLAHLRALNPSLRVWGLSATLGNLQEALQVLMGSTGGTLINGPAAKE